MPIKTCRLTRRHYFLCVNFRPFSFFTCTMRAKINPDGHQGQVSTLSSVSFITVAKLCHPVYVLMTLIWRLIIMKFRSCVWLPPLLLVSISVECHLFSCWYFNFQFSLVPHAHYSILFRSTTKWVRLMLMILLHVLYVWLAVFWKTDVFSKH